MRVTGLILSLAAVALLMRAAWVGCWERSMYYNMKYANTISTTTPGATVSLKDHADVAQAAARDVDSLGLQALLGGALALAGTVVSTAARRAT